MKRSAIIDLNHTLRREALVKRLRDPELQQTQETLWRVVVEHDETKHGELLDSERPGMCCLGVAMSMVPDVSWEPGFYDTDDNAFVDDIDAGYATYVMSGVTASGKFTAYLAPEAMDYYGWVCDDPYVTIYFKGAERSANLSGLNDAGVPFSRIADVIEAQPAQWNGDVLDFKLMTSVEMNEWSDEGE